MSENEPVPKSWVLEGNEASVKKEVFEKSSYKPVLTGGKSPVVLFQEITLPDSGSYFLIGKFRAEIEKGVFFI